MAISDDLNYSFIQYEKIAQANEMLKHFSLINGLHIYIKDTYFDIL